MRTARLPSVFYHFHQNSRA